MVSPFVKATFSSVACMPPSPDSWNVICPPARKSAPASPSGPGPSGSSINGTRGPRAADSPASVAGEALVGDHEPGFEQRLAQGGLVGGSTVDGGHGLASATTVRPVGDTGCH